MTKVGATERTNDFGLVGRLGQAYSYGQRIYGGNYYGNEEVYNSRSDYGAKNYGNFNYGEMGNIWGIYHRRHNKSKVIFARLKFYTPKNPRTETQQNWRAVFTAGMTAWGNLTNDQRAVYNERAKAKKLYGVNLFLREYLNSN